MTLQELRSHIMTNITQPFMSAERITEDVIDEQINIQHLELSEQTTALPEEFDLNIVGQVGRYALDDEFLHIEKVRYDVIDSPLSDASLGYELFERNPFIMLQASEPDDTITVSSGEAIVGEFRPNPTLVEYADPQQYRIEGLTSKKGLIELWPYPPSEHTGKILRLWATTYPETLTDDTDRIVFRKVFSSAIIYGATSVLGNIGNGIKNRNFFEAKHQEAQLKLTRLSNGIQPNRRYRSPYREPWD